MSNKAKAAANSSNNTSQKLSKTTKDKGENTQNTQNTHILNNNDFSSCNSLLMSMSNLNENKKVTIRDLCPEEKQKIGELLKKLAEEKEEKEKLKKLIDQEKKNYDSKLDSLMKEREYLTTSGMNTSINFKSESFMENFLPQPNDKNKIPNATEQIDMKNLRERFNKLFETLKKTQQNQEEYFTKYTNTLSDDASNNLSATISILKEEKPHVLEYKPTPIDSEVSSLRSNFFTPSPIPIRENHHNLGHSNNNFENALQTSIININDEIKVNNQNLYSDRSFDTEDIFNVDDNNSTFKYKVQNSNGILSAKKLELLREKLQMDKREEEKSKIKEKKKSFSNSTNFVEKRNNKYKEMLNRAREKSQEQAFYRQEAQFEDYYPPSEINNLKISTNNFEIKPVHPNFYNETKSRSMISPRSPTNPIFMSSKINRKFDEDDEQLILILNSNTNKVDFVTSYRKKFDLKESNIETKADFYEDNLFDLIDEIESKEHFFSQKQELKKSKIGHPREHVNNIKIDYEIEKEINENMIEIENDLDNIICKKTQKTIFSQKNKKGNAKKINIYEEIQKLNFKY